MSLFDESNYKLSLNKLIQSRRDSERGISRKLAEYLGVHATLVSQVLNGPKDFTEEQMILVCEFFGLAKAESEFLLVLLQRERAGSEKLKAYFQERIEKLVKERRDTNEYVRHDKLLSDADQGVYYSAWYYSCIHLYTTMAHKPRFEEICKRFNLSAEKVRTVLTFLIEKNLVEEKNGRYSAGTSLTELKKSSPFAVPYHRLWRERAILQYDNPQPEDFMTSVTTTLTRSDYAKIRNELSAFFKSFHATVKEGDIKSEDVAHLNIDFFWFRN